MSTQNVIARFDRLVGDKWIPETDEPPSSLRILVRHRLAGGW